MFAGLRENIADRLALQPQSQRVVTAIHAVSRHPRARYARSKGARQQGAAVRGSPKKKAAVSRGRR